MSIKEVLFAVAVSALVGALVFLLGLPTFARRSHRPSTSVAPGDVSMLVGRGANQWRYAFAPAVAVISLFLIASHDLWRWLGGEHEATEHKLVLEGISKELGTAKTALEGLEERLRSEQARGAQISNQLAETRRALQESAERLHNEQIAGSKLVAELERTKKDLREIQERLRSQRLVTPPPAAALADPPQPAPALGALPARDNLFVALEKQFDEATATYTELREDLSKMRQSLLAIENATREFRATDESCQKIKPLIDFYKKAADDERERLMQRGIDGKDERELRARLIGGVFRLEREADRLDQQFRSCSSSLNFRRFEIVDLIRLIRSIDTNAGDKFEEAARKHPSLQALRQAYSDALTVSESAVALPREQVAPR
jgi:DNA repair exonuclease SbcCD ATPase subunit